MKSAANAIATPALKAAVRQLQLSRDAPDAPHFLIAAARYLAAHAPTVRSQKQTFDIAARLHRGEKVFEDDASQE